MFHMRKCGGVPTRELAAQALLRAPYENSMGERVVEAIDRLKSVFREIPGTHLSIDQASRLSGIEPSLCESVISALEDAHFLKRTQDGRYRYGGTDSPRS
jgi:hypothetical protein